MFSIHYFNCFLISHWGHSDTELSSVTDNPLTFDLHIAYENMFTMSEVCEWSFTLKTGFFKKDLRLTVIYFSWKKSRKFCFYHIHISSASTFHTAPPIPFSSISMPLVLVSKKGKYFNTQHNTNIWFLPHNGHLLKSFQLHYSAFLCLF